MIRKIELKDASDYLYLTLQTAKETDYLSRIANETNETLEEMEAKIQVVLQDDGYDILVIEIDGKVVGASQIVRVSPRIKSRHHCELGIKILAQYCNQGLGKQLLEATIDLDKQKDYEMITLSVMKDNQRAIHVYEAFGFIQYGELKNAYKLVDGSYQDEIFMVKYIEK